MEEVGGHTFRSYVRGKVVDFSPENLRNVMRFRAHVQGAATDFETRKEHDQQLDQVLADLCIPGATWKLSTGQLRAEEGNEEGDEGQTHDYDYHHQPEYEQPQPDFKHHQEFNDPPVQPPLYHVPTYTDQHQKDLASIEEQLQNMMWYKQQALENMSKNHAEYMAELRDIKGKQQELYENNDRNASGRESYMVWAHQLANPNLVELSSQKIVKQIYDNIDRKRPMFRGLLKSDLQPSDPTQPSSSSKDPKDPPSSSKDQKDPPK
ncbi:hypothetical protein PIB30_099961 [Stylosanthes scabra]|uniref:Uncharacterized protein n=1 Tax=Stylosanthes scabra TaxID=79078 RepID=A0ABU6QXU5_9FABA|nr:hypothetical protein [Stylosanthes scabra]